MWANATDVATVAVPAGSSSDCSLYMCKDVLYMISSFWLSGTSYCVCTSKCIYSIGLLFFFFLAVKPNDLTFLHPYKYFIYFWLQSECFPQSLPSTFFFFPPSRSLQMSIERSILAVSKCDTAWRRPGWSGLWLVGGTELSVYQRLAYVPETCLSSFPGLLKYLKCFLGFFELYFWI